MIAIDLIDFSGINNRLGHNQGDLILKKISSQIKSIVGDNPVFRFGGDEFIIILHEDNDSRQIIKNLANCEHPMYLGVASGNASIDKLVKQAFSQLEKQKLKVKIS